MTSVTYIFHDCFVVETLSAILVFDYWLDCGGVKRDMPEVLSVADCKKPLYVFVSHGHKDHYNPSIFGWAEKFENVRYIVSRDVWKRMRHVVSETSVYSGPKLSADVVSAMRPGDMAEFSSVKVSAFPSTDIGCSYVVEVDGEVVFHAGDLNAWVWKDESTDAEIRKALGDYRACLRDIESYLKGRQIDYCFFPVDSRIGRDYFCGAAEFVRRFDVLRFFPMHFALGDLEERNMRRIDALKFELYANKERGKYIALADEDATYVVSNE